jgi:hypothetical protein
LVFCRIHSASVCGSHLRQLTCLRQIFNMVKQVAALRGSFCVCRQYMCGTHHHTKHRISPLNLLPSEL